MKPKTFKKKEIIEIATECCDFLENNQEDKFFHKLEFILIQKIPFGKLQPLGEYIGKRSSENPNLYFDILDKFFKKNLNYGYRKGLYNTSRMRMSELEVKNLVYGAGEQGLWV
jgi:hypothetical protein